MIRKYILATVILILLVLPIVSALTITTQPTNINTTTGCAIFNGSATGSAGTYNVWFEYSMNNSEAISGTNGHKSFKTKNQTRTTDGYFGYKQCGIPLLPGVSYDVQAVGEYISGDNQTWTMPTVTPHVTTTYENQVNSFLGSDEYGNDEFDGLKLMTDSIWQPYIGVMGGLFFGLLIAFIFMNVAIKQRTISMTVILLILTGVTFMGLLPAPFVQIGQMLFIAGIAGLLYWLFNKKR